MPKLDEYYHLLRTHEPPLAEDALRASIRAAVERVHLETFGNVEGLRESLTETGVQGASELVSASMTSTPFVAAVETGTTLFSVGGGFGAVALFAGLAVVGVFALAVGLWRVQEGENALLLNVPAQSKQLRAVQETSSVSFAAHQQEQPSAEQQNAVNDNESRKNAVSDQGTDIASAPPIYDNTEELLPPPSNRSSMPDAKHDTKPEPMQMLEMIEQERHRDSLSTKAHSTHKKRDVAHQRQHDLLLVLVQRARECILAPHQHTFKGVPCSLPVAMKGETTLDCVLVMLEQQSVLLHDATLTYLTQQARREKALPALNVLEHYVKEYY